MRDIIINSLNMEDILNKYNIKIGRKGTFLCPFHDDRHPSAKVYTKSFYCFSCNKGGDLIRFVQDYFNLSFKEAMQKINIDFNLRNFKRYKNKQRKNKADSSRKKQEKRRIY